MHFISNRKSLLPAPKGHIFKTKDFSLAYFHDFFLVALSKEDFPINAFPKCSFKSEWNICAILYCCESQKSGMAKKNIKVNSKRPYGQLAKPPNLKTKPIM